ncbi:MAG: cytochrome P450 [Betaproteobacteria bacterium]|nr:cytochrome P450 [Betaproteobacteria bacterium]
MNAPLCEIAELPGPPGLPVLGNALQVSPVRLHTVAEKWRAQYGDFFRFRLGSRRFLAIADAEAIASVLRDRPEGFQRTERLERISREMGFGGLFSSNGAHWKRQRPMVMAGFDPAHIKAYFPTLVKVTERFARRWVRAAEAGREIELQSDLMRYTVDVTAGLAFGADINTIESDREVIQQHLDKVLPALFKRVLSPFPELKLPFLPARRERARHLEALRVAVEGFIAQARARLEANPTLRADPQNLIEAMIVARDSEGSGLTDEDVAGNVLTMLLAGEDTTANTLAWMIYLLSRHPEAARRATEEVRGLLGEARLPTLEQIGKLAYVDACMNETMRLKPVAPIIVNQAARDSVVAGIRVPKGHLVLLLMRPAPTDERHFRDAAAFHPERWLEAGKESGIAAPSSAKRVAMPFGAGPRLCPGRYLAMQEMKMVMAMLFAGFDVASVETPDGGEAREALHLTMAPVGLRLKLSRRK